LRPLGVVDQKHSTVAVDDHAGRGEQSPLDRMVIRHPESLAPSGGPLTAARQSDVSQAAGPSRLPVASKP
jgi:hypothetical protein